MSVCKLRLHDFRSKKIVLCFLHIQDQVINEFDGSDTFGGIFGFELMVDLVRGGMRQGEWPIQSWKGEKPVLMFTVFIMLKCTRGSALAQPFWFLSTW